MADKINTLREQFPEYYNQVDFLNILFHDSRYGRRFIVKKDSEDSFERLKCAAKAEKLIYVNDEYDIYTTLNSYTQKSYKDEDLLNISGIVLDLDCHDENISAKALEDIIENTWTHLCSEYKRGKLLYPTIVVKTGRGLQVFYILQKSISVRYKTDKMLKYYYSLRTAVNKAYEKSLSQKDLLEVDWSTLKDSQLIRLPGTWNSMANTQARIIYTNKNEDGSPTYYSLKDIEKGFSITRSENEKVDFSTAAMRRRLEQLEKLAYARKNTSIKTRKRNMCFIYYSAAKMALSSAEEAVEKLNLFNMIFDEPVDQEYLSRMIKATDQSKAYNGSHEGYYQTSNCQIIDFLKISQKENDICGFWKGQKPECSAKILPFKLSSHVDDENRAWAVASMAKRMKSLEMLRDMRGDACTNKYRELMCHIYYSAAVVASEDLDMAKKATIAFNKGFVKPISNRELQKAIRATEKNGRGYYKYSDKKITEKLHLTDEEREQCFFGVSKKELERTQTHLKKVAARNELHREIADLIENSQMTYQDIANFKGVGLSTVKLIAKEFGLSRNTKHIDNKVDSSEEQVMVIDEKSKNLPICSLGVTPVRALEESEVNYMCMPEHTLGVEQLTKVSCLVDVYTKSLSNYKAKDLVAGQLCFDFNETGELEYYMIS